MRHASERRNGNSACVPLAHRLDERARLLPLLRKKRLETVDCTVGRDERRIGADPAVGDLLPAQELGLGRLALRTFRALRTRG